MASPIKAPRLSAPQMRELARSARMDLARMCAAEGDVLGWGRALMPSKFRIPFCQELHGHLVATRADRFTSTEAPRGHAKTTIGCVLVPLYQGLVEPLAFRHHLSVQSNDDKALTVNRAIKMELEQNDLIHALYGPQVGERWTDAQFVLRNGVAYSAVGSGASIRDINYRGSRPDWVACDDLYNTADDTNNPTGTAKKNDWFWGTLYAAMAQDRPSSMHLQGTAVNREDLFEKLRGDPSVASATFKAVKDWDAQTVLWPELKSFAELERMRHLMGTLIFSREFQNERRDDSTSIVKSSWLRPDNGAPSWEYDPAALRFDEHFSYQGAVVALDPSIGGKKQNDRSGYALVLRGQRDDGSLPVFYIEALLNEHHSFQQRIDAVKGLIAGRHPDRPVSKVRVETISGFKDIGDRIAASVSVPTECVDHVPNKITNLERKSSLFENRRVFLNKNIDPALKAELEYQITTNSPKNDDMRDAVLMALDDGDSGSWAGWV